MINLRTRKVLRDLWGNKTRTALVVLTIAVGVFAAGSISRCWVILSQNLRDSFAAVNPSSASVFTLQTFGEDVVSAVRHMPEVAEAEGHNDWMMRIKVGPNQWHILRLMMRTNYNDQRINIIREESGQYPPSIRQLLLERSTLALVPFEIGDTATIQMPDNTLKEVEFVGTVHDLNRIPTQFSYIAYGYATPDTFRGITGSRGYRALDIVVAGDTQNEDYIQQVVEKVVNRLEANGLVVTHKRIPEPGKHPLDNVIQSTLWLLATLAALALVLSALLVFNVISAVLAQQIQQIGIIKAIGGRSIVVGNMYASTVIVYGTLALIIAVPLGTVMAHFSSIFFAALINFNITEFRIPNTIYLLDVFAGLGLPILASLYPIISGTRISVQDAIRQSGVSSTQFSSSGFEKIAHLLRGLPMTALYAFRNIFRKKVRLTLTLVALIAAGAIFTAVITVRVSLVKTIDEISAYWQEDIYIRYYRTYQASTLERKIKDVPGVKTIEGRITRSGYRQRPDGSESNEAITIYGTSPDTVFLDPKVLEGRWLLPEDQTSFVINLGLLSLEPDLSVGDEIEVNILEKRIKGQVVGIVSNQVVGGDILIAPVVYINYDYLSRKINESEQVNEILIATNQKDQTDIQNVLDVIEERFDSTGFRISSTRTHEDARHSLEDAFDIVLGLLQLMSLEFAIVGALSLMSMMSLNVLERTREMGILRVVGGGRKAIAQIVVTEGIFTGILSWFLGVILAYPLGNYLGNVLGLTLINLPLVNSLPQKGAIIWFFTVLVLSVTASLLPARNASRLSVRETLVYE